MTHYFFLGVDMKALDQTHTVSRSLGATLALMLSGLWMTGQAMAACDINVPAGGSIQTAIDSASVTSPPTTICVAPGSYGPIVINKPLTLLGAQATTDPAFSAPGVQTPRPGGESTISSTYAVSITSGDVVFKGFEIRDFRLGIFIPASGFTGNGGTLQNIEISNNWMHTDVINDAGSGGIGAEPGLLRNLKISRNTIYVNSPSTCTGYQCALYAIGFSQGPSSAQYENIEITNNYIENGPQGLYGFFAGASAYTVKGFLVRGNYFKSQPNGAFLNIGNITPNGSFPALFSDNLIDGARGTVGMDTGTISGNSFRNGSALNLWGTMWSITQPSRNLSIVNNDFNDPVYGRGLLIDSYAGNPYDPVNGPNYGPPTIDSTTLQVHTNAFRDNGINPSTLTPPPWTGYLLANNGLGALDATGNWWGSSSGPVSSRLYAQTTSTPNASINTTGALSSDAQDPAKAVPPAVPEWPLSTLGLTRVPGFWPVPQSTTALSMNPPFVDADGNNTTTLSATLKAADAGLCNVSGQTVVFTITGVGSYSATVNGNGVASVSVHLPLNHVYEVVAAFAGSTSCLASSSDPTSYTVVSAGDATYGGGWYKPTSNPVTKANFGFVAEKTVDRKSGTTLFRGELVWVHDKLSRVKSTSITGLGDVACPDNINFRRCAIITGFGELSVWVPDASGGTWQRNRNVSFSATVYDGGNLSACNKKSCKSYERPDFFGMNVDGVVLTGESTPITLSGGTIRVK